MRRRKTALAAALGAALLGALLVAPPALAAPVAVAADANTWQADGRVDVVRYSADAGSGPNVVAEPKALALCRDGSIHYAGGTFKKVNGIPRTEVAAITAWSAATPNATLLPWDAEPSGTHTIHKGSLIPSSVNTL